MSDSECLTFDQLYGLIRNQYPKQKTHKYSEHIKKCSRCADELTFVQKVCRSFGSEQDDRFSDPRIVYRETHPGGETIAAYFQGSLSKNESARIDRHLAECPSCESEFNSISAAAHFEISKDEQHLIQEIEGVQIEDRLSFYKRAFIVSPAPGKSSSIKSERRVGGWLNFWRAVPDFVWILFLILLAPPLLFYGYQKVMKYQAVNQAMERFAAFSDKILVKDFELRPTGDFKYDLIGSRRIDEERPQDIATRQTLEQTLTLDPQNARIHHLLGTLYFFSGEIDRAEEFYLKALEFAGSNAKIFNDLALIDVYRNAYQKALERLEQAINLDPALMEAYYNRAVVFELQGDKSQALAAWRTYIEKEPDANSTWVKVANVHIQELTEN